MNCRRLGIRSLNLGIVTIVNNCAYPFKPALSGVMCSQINGTKLIAAAW